MGMSKWGGSGIQARDCRVICSPQLLHERTLLLVRDKSKNHLLACASDQFISLLWGREAVEDMHMAVLCDPLSAWGYPGPARHTCLS